MFVDATPSRPDTSDKPEEPATFEDRMVVWLQIFSGVVAVLWMIDEATHGEMSEQAKYRWRRWRARHKQEQRVRLAAAHAVFEAMRIVDSA
jgi:hypothetical protein